MKNVTLLNKIVLTLLVLILCPLHAATIAIMDTGADLDHPLLRKVRFVNGAEVVNGQDSDGNGYIDDISGWNLITEAADSFIPANFPLPFHEDFYRYYEIRRKRSLKISTEEEDEWYKIKRKDDEFQEVRSQFRRYIHATHVAGLASGLSFHWGHSPGQYHEADIYKPDILTFTYLGDTETGVGAELNFKPLSPQDPKALDHLKDFIQKYLAWQKRKLSYAVTYNAQFAHIINSSFGISTKSANKMVKGWWDEQFPGEESALLTQLQDDFRAGLLRITKEVVDQHPKVLFVFSAGNTDDNTTLDTHYPSGVKCDHCISVGASLGTFDKASFSNYGKSTVTLFAPGVAIPSSVPPGRVLPVNGTSQAAPQVSHAAAVLFQQFTEAGHFVRMSTLKRILMDTVDIKIFLTDKCESGGILNLVRAMEFTKQLLKSRNFSAQNYQRILSRVKAQIPDQVAPNEYNIPLKSQDFFYPLEADPLNFSAIFATR